MSALDFRLLLSQERIALRSKQGVTVPNWDVSLCLSQPQSATEKILSDYNNKISLNISSSQDSASLIDSIPNMLYFSDIINPHDESSLTDMIESSGRNNNYVWKQLKSRRLQCWGKFPPALNASDADLSTEMPIWLDAVIDELVRMGIFHADTRPDNVLINQYSANEGILHHTDGPAYHDRVAIISLGSDCIMSFRKNLSSDLIGKEYAGDVCSVLLQRRSLFMFEKEAYSEYKHGIEIDQPVQVVGSHGPCVNLHLVGISGVGVGGVADGTSAGAMASGENLTVSVKFQMYKYQHQPAVTHKYHHLCAFSID